MYPTVFGNVRTPYTNNIDAGIRKNIQLKEKVGLQLRIDAFNALNHPRFPGPGNTADALSKGTFGYLNNSKTKLVQNNAPRMVQLGAKITF